MIALFLPVLVGLTSQNPAPAPKPRVAIIPILDLERQHPRKAMMLTQLDRLVAKQLRQKGYNLVSPDDVESAISSSHLDFTQHDERSEANLLRVGEQTHADLVALVVVTKIGAEFVTPDESAPAGSNNSKQLKFEPWAVMRFWLSDQKSRHALFADKEVEGHCVWKFRLANDAIDRIAAATAVGIEDEVSAQP